MRFIIFLPIVLLAAYLVNKIIIGGSAKSRFFLLMRKILPLLPLVITLLLLFIAVDFIFFNEKNFGFFFSLLSFISLIALLLVYFAIAIAPSQFAFLWIKNLEEIERNDSPKKIITFWNLSSQIKSARRLSLFLLIFLLITLFLANIVIILTNNLIFSLPSSSTISDYLILIMPLTFLIIYFFLEYIYYGKVDLPEIESEKSFLLKKQIEKMSILTGMPAPQYKVLAVNNPTAFSIYPNFGKPIIYITAPLLNLADKNELEAVIAHEFAHIFSGRIIYFKRLHAILVLLRTLSLFMFFLLTASFGQIFIYIWMLLVFYSCVNVFFNIGMKISALEIFFRLLTPPLTIVNFISYLFYYFIARNEEFYADLKTIEFTRYPAGIYSILEKIKKYSAPKEKLPARFSHLYFTAETSEFSEIPPIQPLIEERQNLLEKIDYSLSNLKHKSETISCPSCQNPMTMIMLDNFYGDPLKAHFCKKCQGYWLDRWIFWCVGKLPKIRILVNKKIQSKTMTCPRCGTSLSKYSSPDLPESIKIWNCQVCKGNWISHSSAEEYLRYREKRREHS